MNNILIEIIDIAAIEALLMRIPQALELLLVGIALAATAAILRSVLGGRKDVGSVGHETE